MKNGFSRGGIMDLDSIRKDIKEIDIEIIELISKRLALISIISQTKRDKNISTFQAEREKQMYRQYWNLAVEHKINPELVRQVFDLIMSESRKIQQELLTSE